MVEGKEGKLWQIYAAIWSTETWGSNNNDRTAAVHGGKQLQQQAYNTNKEILNNCENMWKHILLFWASKLR